MHLLRTQPLDGAAAWASVRAAAVFGFVAAVLSYGAVVGVSFPVPSAPVSTRTTATSPDGQPLWETSYAERFPGCVSTLLWPMTEVPESLLTRAASGEVARVSVREAQTRVEETIGACR